MVKPVPDGYRTVTPYLIVKRAAQLVDFPCGNTWWIATHVEDVPPAELERRAAEAARQRQS
jgi:hypothetical protein